jgi:hypothetical protein
MWLAHTRSGGGTAVPTITLSGNEGRAFFRCAIDIGRQKLPIPVQLLGRVRLVINVDRDCLAFFEA